MKIDKDNFSMDAFGEDFELVEDFDPQIPTNDQDKDSDKDIDNKDDNSDSSEEEKEIVADKKDKDEEGSEGSSKDDSSQNVYSSLASALATDGILSSSKDIKSSEDLFNAIKAEIQTNELSDLNDTQKQYLEALRVGVPIEEFKQVKSFEQQLEGITEDSLSDNEELRKSIITQDYMNQGIDETKAAKLAQRSIDLNEDLADAKEALLGVKQFTKDSLNKRIEAQKEVQKNIAKGQEDELKNIKKTVDDLKEIIPGMQINEKVKNEIYSQMTKTVAQSKDGKPLNAVMKAREEDPVNFTIKMHYLFHLTNGFKNFDKVVKSSKSKAVQDLDDLLKGNTFIPSGSQAQKNMNYDIDDNLKTVLENL